MEMCEDKLYKCSCCGKAGAKAEIARHEAHCIADQKAREEAAAAYRKKHIDRLMRATDWARNSKPVSLLLEYGHIDAAEVLCREWAKRNLWDCGTSSGWSEVYKVMIDAAKR